MFFLTFTLGYIENYSKKYRDDMGTGASDSAIEAMAAKIYNFESLVAHKMWTRTESRDPANTQRKSALNIIQTNSIVSSWSGFLNNIFDKVNVDGIDVNGADIVQLADEKWFNNTNDAITEAGMTDNDLLDYIAWRVHMSVIGYLGFL